MSTPVDKDSGLRAKIADIIEEGIVAIGNMHTGNTYRLKDSAEQGIMELVQQSKVEAVTELRRRWDEDRKTMDYSPDTYLFICDKYLAELKKEL